MASIKKYNNQTGQWEIIELSVVDNIAEAPSDDKMYGRKNGLWAQCQPANVIVSHGAYESYVTLAPNVLHIFPSGESLSINFDTDSEVPDIVNEYMIQFSTASVDFTLSLPETVVWLNDEVPVINANKTYQLSIINNLAVIGEFANV